MPLPKPPSPVPVAVRGRRAPGLAEANREELRRLDARLAARGASRATAKIYRGWVRRFLAHDRNPRTDPGIAIDRFLADLRGRACSTASQRQALPALGFHFREVRGIDAAALLRRHRPARRRCTPASPPPAPEPPAKSGAGRQLVAGLASASGRPEAEILALRIGDVDLERGLVRLRRDGVARRRGIPVAVPTELQEALLEQVGESWRVYQLEFLSLLDRRASPGFAGARLPTEVFRRRPLFPTRVAPGERGRSRRPAGVTPGGAAVPAGLGGNAPGVA